MAYVRDAVLKSLFPCFQKQSHASFLMFRILLDRSVDSIRWERYAHVVVLYRVTLVCVCVLNNPVDSIRWKPSGEAPFGLTHSHVHFFNCGNPTERVQM